MPALGALAELSARPRGVECVTADAMKGGAPTFELESMMIAAVIPKPESGKCDADERAIDDNGGGEIEHERKT